MVAKAKQERVLVTGAGGFIGGHVVSLLLEQGYAVRGAELFPERCSNLTELMKQGKTLEVVQADLLKADTWPAAMQDCDYVIHMASVVAMDCPEHEAEERMIRPAKEGTINVLKAAADAGVKRVVITSSLGAIGAPGDLRKRAQAGLPIDSSMWTDLPRATPYCKSKTIGERTAWDFVNSAEAKGMELVAINPGIVVGPALSNHLHESMKLSIRLLKPRSGAMPDVMMPLVHVLDVAEAHINALKAEGAQGKRFLLIKEVTDMHSLGVLINPVFEPLGYPVPVKKLPWLITRLIAFIDTPLRRSLDLCGLRPAVDTTPAEQILGVPKREVQGAFIDMSVDAIAKGHVEKTEAFVEWHKNHYKPT